MVISEQVSEKLVFPAADLTGIAIKRVLRRMRVGKSMVSGCVGFFVCNIMRGMLWWLVVVRFKKDEDGFYIGFERMSDLLISSK